MHMLKSYIDAVGNLMTETELLEIMSPVFSGVQKMLIGNKFPNLYAGTHNGGGSSP